jgi:ribosome-associated toxin RatA of RatAB toxin-antitoxin module
MSERTSSTITVDASSAEVMRVIAAVEDYPEWTGSVRSVDVLEAGDDGRPLEATFRLDAGAVRDTYTLRYTWDGDSELSWTLVEAQILTSMNGCYRLTAVSDQHTQVDYELTLDLKIPMIGLLRRKAEKVITDTALKELKKRVEQ